MYDSEFFKANYRDFNLIDITGSGYLCSEGIRKFDLIFNADLSSVTGAVDLALVRLISDDPAHGPGAAVSFAANLLDLFCQLNWTGPPLADFALPSTTPDVLVGCQDGISHSSSVLSTPICFACS